MFVFGYARGHIGVTPSWTAEGSYLYIRDSVEDDNWHHVAAVVREAELPNLEYDVTLYKDGEVAILHNIGLLALWPINTPSGLDVAIGRGLERTSSKDIGKTSEACLRGMPALSWGLLTECFRPKINPA